MAAQEELAVVPAATAAESPPAVRRRKVERGQRRVYTRRGAFDYRVSHLRHYRRTIGHFGWVFVTRKVRGMWLGVLWVPLRPALDMFSRGFVFGGLLGVSGGDRPYLIYLMVGSSAWVFFERAAYWGFRGLPIHKRVVMRSQVPWLTVVIAAFIPALVEMFLYGLTAIMTILYYLLAQGKLYITLNVTTLASLAGFAMLALYAMAWGMITGGLVVRVPDLRYMLRYVLPLLYYITPIVYATSKLPPQYRVYAEYNPLTAPIELFKYGLIGTGAPPFTSILASLIGLAVFVPFGLLLMTRLERMTHKAL